jgi:hypothetical protein
MIPQRGRLRVGPYSLFLAFFTADKSGWFWLVFVSETWMSSDIQMFDDFSGASMLYRWTEN